MAVGVLVDANVLFSRTLRDWLFLLRNESAGELYRVYTSTDIIAEVLYRLRRQRPRAPGSLTSTVHDRIRDSLDDLVRDFDVDGSFEGTDADDAHVHAAALACRASILLTDDAGFARMDDDGLRPYEVHSADSFFVTVDDSQPLIVRSATQQQYHYWSSRPESKLLDRALRDAGCTKFASRVAGHLVALGLRAL